MCSCYFFFWEEVRGGCLEEGRVKREVVWCLGVVWFFCCLVLDVNVSVDFLVEVKGVGCFEVCGADVFE